MTLLGFHNSDSFIWLNGSCVPWREARIHVLNHGLHYRSCVFDADRDSPASFYGELLGSGTNARREVIPAGVAKTVRAQRVQRTISASASSKHCVCALKLLVTNLWREVQ